MRLFDINNYCFKDVITPIPEGCYLVETQDEINQISASITGNGKVWVEDGTLKWTGKAPSPAHIWNDNEWVISEEKQSELLSENRQKLIENIDNTASNIITKWTRFESEYKEREKAALEYQAQNYQGDVSVYITSFADAANIDNKSAALLILQQANQLRDTLAKMSALRMRKYELKQDDLTLDNMQTIHNDIIAEMQALAEVQQ